MDDSHTEVVQGLSCLRTVPGQIQRFVLPEGGYDTISSRPRSSVLTSFQMSVRVPVTRMVLPVHTVVKKFVRSNETLVLSSSDLDSESRRSPRYRSWLNPRCRPWLPSSGRWSPYLSVMNQKPTRPDSRPVLDPVSLRSSRCHPWFQPPRYWTPYCYTQSVLGKLTSWLRSDHHLVPTSVQCPGKVPGVRPDTGHPDNGLRI